MNKIRTRLVTNINLKYCVIINKIFEMNIKAVERYHNRSLGLRLEMQMMMKTELLHIKIKEIYFL